MSPRQVGVTPCFSVDERRIFLERFVGPVSMAKPQLVLAFLTPGDRRLGTAHLENQVVLMTTTNLGRGKASFRAIVEPYENGGEVFHLDVDDVNLVSARGHLECFA